MKNKYAVLIVLFTVTLSFGQTITTLWNYPLPDRMGRTASPAIASDGTVYIGCNLATRVLGNAPNFFAIKPDGTLKWSTSIQESPTVPANAKPDAILSSASIHSDGSIFMQGQFTRSVFKLNPVDGSTTALFTGLGRAQYTAPAFSPDGASVYLCLYSTTSNRGVRSFKADLSVKNWDFLPSNEFNCTPAVGVDGTIYAASNTTSGTSRYLYAINPDGTQKWASAYATNTGFVSSALAIGVDGTIYLSAKLTATPDGVLKAYNPADGSEKWSVTLAGTNAEQGGPAIAADGTLYLGNAGGIMRAYSPVDGSQLWSFAASGNIEVVPAIDDLGRIYFGTTTGNFYVLNSDGTQAYDFLDLGDSITSSAAIGSDGRIYVASTTGTGAGSGKLYALQTTATGLASGNWPMYGKTPRHTSNARHFWTGAKSADWSDKLNWDLGVPNLGNDVAIPAGTINQPAIAIHAKIQSLIIGTDAKLTVNEGKSLDVSGNITNSGDLLLKSSPIGTASLLTTLAADNVTQQRYLSSNQRGWRLLSNPLTTTTFGTLATNSTTPITLGNNASGAYQSASNSWTSGGDADSMLSQQAYKIFLRGRTSEVTGTTYSQSIPSNVTLAIKGTATNTSPSPMVTTAGQYYLVANPYTAPVSVYSILGASSGLSTTVSYYNPSIGSSGSAADLILKYGAYANPTITAATPGDANDVVLPPMGAIFVQATANGTINVPKTAIFTGTAFGGSYNHKIAETKTAKTNALKVEVTSNGTYYDTVALYFKILGEVGNNVDFGKLPNTIVDFYSLKGSNPMAVLEVELKDQIIPLGITSTIQKSYTLRVTENSIPIGFEAELIDNVLNTKTILAPGSIYNFAVDSSTISQGSNRFAINLKTSATLSVATNVLDSQFRLWPNPTTNQVNITNEQNYKEGATSIIISTINGQVIHSQKSNPGTTTTIPTNGWAAGVYIVKATNNGDQTIKKLIIQ